eukprot:352324-Chlamydomonas_euryale.AAC.3
MYQTFADGHSILNLVASPVCVWYFLPAFQLQLNNWLPLVTLGRPAVQQDDLQQAARVAGSHNLLSVPFLCRPKKLAGWAESRNSLLLMSFAIVCDAH